MKRLKQVFVCSLMALLAAGIWGAGHAQTLPRFEQELARLETALTTLKEAAKPRPARSASTSDARPAGTRELLQIMLRDLARIDGALPPSWSKEETYAAAFQAYAEMVEDIVRTDPALADADQLQGLRDLQMQLAELRIALYSPMALESKQVRGQTVAVTIKAIANGLEVKGLQARCTPFALRSTHPDLHIFKGLTTTSAEALMPGRYEFRIFRNNELLSAATYPVGLNGESAELIEFAIPETK